MKKLYIVLSLLFLSAGAFSQTLYDSYTDGDYTANPVWAGTAGWTIVANSDVAAGATGSNTLRLNAPAVSQTDYLSSQIATWGVSQEWGFFLGRRAQAYTGANQAYFWLYANEANLTSATVDGYRIAVGDDAGNDEIRLEYIVNGALSATVITSTAVFTNGLTDIGILIRVTRSSTGAWEIFTSAVPGANGAGAIATDIPNAANAPTSRGTGTNNALVPSTNGYIGVAALHSTGGNAIVSTEFDQVYFTPTVGGTPTINVTPASLTGFQALSGVPTAEQTYTVDGSNLTADITITPPVGFQIATVTGGPYTTNPASITLTQTAGSVPITTIFVRMNSTTLGVNTGNISNTSTGANNPNVSVTGKVLAAEPTTQGAITIGTVTNSTIDVTFTAGDGAKQILVIHALTPVANDPVDGTTYTANTAYGAGSNLGANTYVVYNGVSGNGGAPVTITGLTVGTLYHFGLYEYNDGGAAGAENYLLPPATANATTLNLVNTYIWSGANGTLWTDPLNWLPVRTTPATNDSLLFIGPLNVTVTGVPAQTIGYMGVSLGANVTLQAAVATTALTISGGFTGEELEVQAGSQLNISGANGFTINIPTGNTSIIDGDMTFTAGAHKFTAGDANGITFNTGSSFTAGTGFSSNPFGTTGTANSVVFISGSIYNQVAGSNPFALAQPASIVVFQTGSLFRMLSNLAPSLSGRTYADLEIDNPAFSQSGTGGGALSIDNLTITQGLLLGLNTTGGVSIKGNITTVAGSTLNFLAAGANTVTFDGTAPQVINIGGTLGWSATESLTINNAAGVDLNRDITLGAATTLALTNGILKLNAPATMLTLSSGTTLTGGNSNASYVDGKVKKIGNTAFTFPIGKTGTGYVPIRVSNFQGTTAVTDEFAAEYLKGNANNLGAITDPLINHVSHCDYWRLDNTAGTPTVDVTGYWSANNNNNCGPNYIDNLAELALVHFNGTSWNSSSVGVSPAPNGTVAAGDITWPSVTTFSPFALGSTSVNNPLPITINYFTGVKQSSDHVLNWKVTCTNTPSVTMVLERSNDGGRTYAPVHTIAATALQCQQPFSYTDAAPAKGVNYYRLKLTDANGKVTYSSVVNLINGTKGYDILPIAPNPIVAGKFNLRVSAAQASVMDVLITDMQGRVLHRQTASLVSGFNQVPVNVSKLAAGTYQVIASTAEGRTGVLRFVIQ